MLYPQSRDMRHIMKNVVSAPSGSPQQAVNSIPKPPFRWRYIYVTAYHFCWWWILRCRYTFWCGLISIFFTFSIMFLLYTLILLVSQPQTHHLMTSQIKLTHRIFTTNFLFSCTHFILIIDEKSSHADGFKYDLMMILDNRSVFWATLYSIHAAMAA